VLAWSVLASSWAGQHLTGFAWQRVRLGEVRPNVACWSLAGRPATGPARTCDRTARQQLEIVQFAATENAATSMTSAGGGTARSAGGRFS